MTTADVHLITAEVAVLKSQMDDVKTDVADVKNDVKDVRSDVKSLRDEFIAFKGSLRVVLYLAGFALTFLVGVGVAVVVRWITGA